MSHSHTHDDNPIEIELDFVFARYDELISAQIRQIIELKAQVNALQKLLNDNTMAQDNEQRKDQ